MPRIPQSIRLAVRDRANARCEYCQMPDKFSDYPYHVEHIIALKHRGTSDMENLAWSCLVCNGFKGTDIGGIDPESGVLTPLYHPRQDNWHDHFEMVDGIIIGKSPIGRTTVILLQMNNEETVEFRQALINAELW